MVEIVMQLGSHINVEKEIAHGNITAEIFTFGSFFFFFPIGRNFNQEFCQ